jgi:hypothetical protein
VRLRAHDLAAQVQRPAVPFGPDRTRIAHVADVLLVRHPQAAQRRIDDENLLPIELAADGLDQGDPLDAATFDEETHGVAPGYPPDGTNVRGPAARCNLWTYTCAR